MHTCARTSTGICHATNEATPARFVRVCSARTQECPAKYGMNQIVKFGRSQGRASLRQLLCCASSWES